MRSEDSRDLASSDRRFLLESMSRLVSSSGFLM